MPRRSSAAPSLINRVPWLAVLARVDFLWMRRLVAVADRCGLLKSYAIHTTAVVVGLMLGWSLLWFIDALEAVLLSGRTWSAGWSGSRWAVQEIQAGPLEDMLIVIASWVLGFILGQNTYVGFASLMAGWGAGPDTVSLASDKSLRATTAKLMFGPKVLRASTLTAVRRYWMLTPALVALGLVATAWGAAGDLVRELLIRGQWVPGTWIPARDWDVLRVLCLFAWLTLGVAAVKRATLPAGFAKRCRWPPRCRSCDFNVLGLRPGAQCPECGEHVWRSMVRRPRRGPINPWRILLTPSHPHRRLHPLSPPAHRGYRVRWIIRAALAAACGAALMQWQASPYAPKVFSAETFMYCVLSFVGIAGFTLFASCAAATLIAALLNSRHPVNLLPASSAAASYASPLFAVWVVVLYAGLMTIRWATSHQPRWSDTVINVLAGLFIACNVAAFLWYLLVVARATGASRKSNF